MHKPVTAGSRRGPPPYGELDLRRLDACKRKQSDLDQWYPGHSKINMKEMSEEKLPERNVEDAQKCARDNVASATGRWKSKRRAMESPT